MPDQVAVAAAGPPTPRTALFKAMERLREKEERLAVAFAPPRRNQEDGDVPLPAQSQPSATTAATTVVTQTQTAATTKIMKMTSSSSTLVSVPSPPPLEVSSGAPPLGGGLAALRLTLWMALTFALVLSSLVLQGVFYALSSPDDWLAFASEVGRSRNPRAAGAASASSASASLVSATEGVLAALRESPLSWQGVFAPLTHKQLYTHTPPPC